MFHFIGQHSECEPFSCARGSYIAPNIIHLKRVQNKFDCHNYDIFLINELGSSLNVQSDSIRVKTRYHFYLICQRAQPSEDTRLARRQHYRAERIAQKISSACKVTFLL